MSLNYCAHCAHVTPHSNLSIHHVASSLGTVVRNAAEVLPPPYVIWLHVVTDGPWEAHDDHAVRLMVGSTAAQEHGTTLPQSAPPVPRKRWRLKPYGMEAATLWHGGCNPMYPDYTPMYPGSAGG